MKPNPGYILLLEFTPLTVNLLWSTDFIINKVAIALFMINILLRILQDRSDQQQVQQRLMLCVLSQARVYQL